jgi:hypothetical protein
MQLHVGEFIGAADAFTRLMWYQEIASGTVS